MLDNLINWETGTVHKLYLGNGGGFKTFGNFWLTFGGTLFDKTCSKVQKEKTGRNVV